MFVVPEVDDDMDVSISIEATKLTAQPTATKASPSLCSMASSAPVPSSIENVEQLAINAPIPSSVNHKEHRSRRSLFHRNTIHICDQIVDRV
jgi:hypothetical protein